MSRPLKFAQMLAGRLQGASVAQHGHQCYRILGRCDTGPVIASLEIRVPWLLADLKTKPPSVWCHEKWMKTGPDWHNGPPLCWVLRDEWHDAMNWKGKSVRAILDEGREWLFNGAICLINRHYYADLMGLIEWPEEWAFWSHFQAGSDEYRREQQR